MNSSELLYREHSALLGYKDFSYWLFIGIVMLEIKLRIEMFY